MTWNVFITKLFGFIKYHILRNEYYLWYIVRKSRERSIRANLLKAYNERTSQEKSYLDCVVCIYRGDIIQGGLADRLRGILSVYKVCRDVNVPFRLYFVHPFKLELFLVSNRYDWHISESDIYNKVGGKSIVILDSTSDSEYQKKKQEGYLLSRINKINKQIHVYSNASFSYKYNYAELFGELFQLSPRLSVALEKSKNAIGGKYISVSARFLNILDDFNETFGINRLLSTYEKNDLIHRNLEQIDFLHKEHPDVKVLVNSDSSTFLKIAKTLPYVYENPGFVTHIDNVSNEGGYEQFEKTFLDFFMIANAEEVFLLRTGAMHKSGYPYAASLIYNKPFRIIEF